MSKLPGIFGSKVFNERIMQERLPKETYKAFKQTICYSDSLDRSVADVIAAIMKDWAIEHGATHFTHWFQPMTGVTAEKHDSFIAPTSDGGIIMEFSGKELIKGEPDASSFPSGGLRATFEARGYTAWDPTSHAFVKDGTLYIPSIFCSYDGAALDKKTPLLRSMELISKQAMRILKLFGNNNATRVITTVGPEQEYFLIDAGLYKQRKDLVLTGRTLFGSRPPKGQELEDHYFGSIKPRVQAYMQDLDEELWKLGILAKTKHNEVAPAQHELAPIYSDTNQSTDHNQLTMEVMKKVARCHDLACLLHEKPFAGVNGSGKHNNWSLSTDTGLNLLDPGESPAENPLFLLFLTAVIKAVDDYQAMLRCTIANVGNDHRLGSNEAPPAIMSMFLGDELTAILESIENGGTYVAKEKIDMRVGVDILPSFPKDTTDRNRTSPFAFTGNKFEFRMLGSMQSIAGPNIALNTIVADVLCQFADRLEDSTDLNQDLNLLLKHAIHRHKRIIFNGNNYSNEWVAEAERRGLLNLKSTVDALPWYVAPDNIRVFTQHGIFTETEMYSRYEIHLENYCNTLTIEALTMVDMARREILPAVNDYVRDLSHTALQKKQLSSLLPTAMEEDLLLKISNLTDSLYHQIQQLEENLLATRDFEAGLAKARFYCDNVLTAMQSLRLLADQLEPLVGEKYWPFPTYSQLLFYI